MQKIGLKEVDEGYGLRIERYIVDYKIDMVQVVGR
jgi:hypothetical protein